jgi:hypothetical protein
MEEKLHQSYTKILLIFLDIFVQISNIDMHFTAVNNYTLT